MEIWNGTVAGIPARVGEWAGADSQLALDVGTREGQCAWTIVKPGAIETTLGLRIDTEKLYGGMDPDEVLSQRTDVLAARVFSLGEPAMKTVLSLLPPVDQGMYAVLGSPQSWGKLFVDRAGAVWRDRRGWEDGTARPVWSQDLGKSLQLALLDGWMPIVMARAVDGDSIDEVFYFVPIGLTHRAPTVWIRHAHWAGTNLTRDRYIRLEYNGTAYETAAAKPDDYWDLFITAVTYYRRQRDQWAVADVSLEPAIARWVAGCSAMASVTYTAASPHYGARSYGEEVHDGFPPNFLTMVENTLLLGDACTARRQVEHVMDHLVDAYGRFCYWQGRGKSWDFASAGTEYGQWLWLVARYQQTLFPEGLSDSHLRVVAEMGEWLLRCQEEGTQSPGRALIVLCAEADNRSRKYVYTANNLWVVRGLEGAAEILQDTDGNRAERFLEAAQTLMQAISAAVADERKRGAGALPPFRLGYSATPWSLSGCASDGTVKPDDYEAYLGGEVTHGQDLLENTYANYRYYLEMLSAELLTPEDAAQLRSFRRRAGGELLGMTRFYRWVDDWPAANYARHLLEHGEVDRYLLLFYAHLCHHGNRDVLCYPEQVTVDGRFLADDSLPNLVLVPTMVAWMFAFEPVSNNDLYLASAIPDAWLKPGGSVTAERIGTSRGPVGIAMRRESATIQISLNLPAYRGPGETYLSIRADGIGSRPMQILEGAGLVEGVNGNRLRLKQGTVGAVTLTVGISATE